MRRRHDPIGILSVTAKAIISSPFSMGCRARVALFAAKSREKETESETKEAREEREETDSLITRYTSAHCQQTLPETG